VDEDYLPAYNLSNTLSRVIPRLAPTTGVFVHYCSLAAFYSIIESRKIRYTSALSTNDPSEFLLGSSIVNECVRTTLPGILRGARLARSLQPIHLERRFRAFVFCMTEAVDDEADVGDLSQWRLYGADGRGVGLVFDASETATSELLSRLGSIPRRIVYGEDEGRRLVEEVIQDYLRDFEALPESTKAYLERDPVGLNKANYLQNTVFWLPSVIKHRAYRHEREVRLVRGDIGDHVGNPLIFPDRAGLKRPTVECAIGELDGPPESRWTRSPIRKVIIGPSGDQSAIEDSIRYFMEAHSWTLEIGRSDIPYRAL